MRLSRYFVPILKDTPAEATIASHRLMLRAGLIRSVTMGIYSWLPLGLKLLTNISNIVRVNMNQAGAIELLMPCIQPAELWQKSGRYEDYGKEMLRIKDRSARDLLFGPTNEEVITEIVKNSIKTYRELPKNLYQIQWKFRDEIRPRFGVMRGREFLMKDAYSFDLDFSGAKKSYDNMYSKYFSIFKALGLNAIAVRADSGAIGGNLSHEFHIVADTGESQIFYDAEFDDLAKQSSLDIDKMHSLYAAADEKHDPKNCTVPKERLISKRGIEVGHIFYFGTKYSKMLAAQVTNNKGEQIELEMGSYGIGISRLVGAIIESNHDDKGIIWPEEVAPFKFSLLNLKTIDDNCVKLADKIYHKLSENNTEVLYDDTEETAGKKFATHDLLGMPWQIIVGPRLASNNRVELRHRQSYETIELSIDDLFSKVI